MPAAAAAAGAATGATPACSLIRFSIASALLPVHTPTDCPPRHRCTQGSAATPCASARSSSSDVSTSKKRAWASSAASRATGPDRRLQLRHHGALYLTTTGTSGGASRTQSSKSRSVRIGTTPPSSTERPRLMGARSRGAAAAVLPAAGAAELSCADCCSPTMSRMICSTLPGLAATRVSRRRPPRTKASAGSALTPSSSARSSISDASSFAKTTFVNSVLSLSTIGSSERKLRDIVAPAAITSIRSPALPTSSS
mmetsp:Transcript_14525/g.46363  ORF Transcript_14525/g.46363 Transcript_14525/m.46363 type:complete len:255 (-) Transcript_14525:71-835(-)